MGPEPHLRPHSLAKRRLGKAGAPGASRSSLPRGCPKLAAPEPSGAAPPPGAPRGPDKSPRARPVPRLAIFTLFLRAVFPVSLPGPARASLPVSRLSPSPKEGPKDLWQPAAEWSPPPPPPSPRGAAALPASEASGSAEPRHHVTAGLASEARRKPLTKPVPVPPLPGPRLLASRGPPARAEPRRKRVAAGLAARETGAGSPGGLQPRTARPPGPSRGRLGAAPPVGRPGFVPSPRRGQRLLPASRTSAGITGPIPRAATGGTRGGFAPLLCLHPRPRPGGEGAAEPPAAPPGVIPAAGSTLLYSFPLPLPPSTSPVSPPSHRSRCPDAVGERRRG